MKDIYIKGYKSLGNVKLSGLKKVNYLVGENGSGKSSVLEVLQILNAALDGTVGQGSFSIRGFSKYAITETEMIVKVETPADHVIEIRLSKDKDVDVNGNINHGKECLFLDGDNLSPQFNGKNRREHFRDGYGGAFSFRSSYITTFQEEPDSDSQSYIVRPTGIPFTYNNVDKIEDRELIDFLNEHYKLPDGMKVVDISASIRGDKAVQFTLKREVEQDGAILHHKDGEQKIPFAALSGGLRAITRLYFGIIDKLRDTPPQDNQVRIICIEEPENGFHPELQKKVPAILEGFVSKYSDLTFLVTTHSPFIVSAASLLENTQRIYLFDRGHLVNLLGEPVPDSGGYGGSNCLNVVSKMLGAGFSDLSAMPKTHEQFTVVYCEGKNKNTKDATLYKKIFLDKNIIFVSCGDLVDAVRAFRVGAEAAKFMLGKDTKVLALVDRSYGRDYDSEPILKLTVDKQVEKTHSGKPQFTDEERKLIMSTDELGRIQVLERKEIENYIFDPAIVDLLESSLKKHMTIPGNLDYASSEVKDRITIPPSKEAEIKQKLASIIYEHKDADKIKDIYSELASYFGIA